MVNRVNKPELHVDTVADWEAWLDSDPDPTGSDYDCEEGDDPTRDHVRRGAGCRAVLRVDRWAVALP